MFATSDLIQSLDNATTIEDDAFDVRFEEVVSLVDQNKLEEACSLISRIFSEGVIDIRLVMYQFYAQFISHGIQSLEEIFPALEQILLQRWDSISPVNQRDKYLLHSLNWFFSSITKQLKRSEKLHKEKKPDRFWQQSVNSLSNDKIEKLHLAIRSMENALLQKIDEASMSQYIHFIDKWLDGINHVVDVPPPPILEETHDTETPAPVVKKSTTSLQEMVHASELMDNLVRKLRAFELLIQNQNFEKAALIADDISVLIKNFDPAIYFPKLFTQYFALTATYIDSLSQEWENKGSLKWDALNRLYQSDLEGFIEW